MRMPKIKREKKIEYFKTWMQISIMVIAIFAFAYFMSESSKDREEIRISPWFVILKLIGKFIFSEKGLVSALEASDLQNGVATCMRTDDGKICQEYPASECAVKCNITCIPSDMAHVAECKLGTCFDPNEGTCAVGSPKPICEGNGGKWFDDSKGNIIQCKKGCCIMGSQAIFSTEVRCARIASLIGIERTFKPEIKSELACLALSNVEQEGACVLSEDIFTGKKTCMFMTKGKCLESKGSFYAGYLCSNTELNTNCTREKTTSCVEGKDEVYWFDSCGNRENIYDADLEKSWNSGKVLSKEESCVLGSGDNPTANRGTCGNCNYLLSSRCGNKTSVQRLNDARQGVVCRDLSCVDEQGNRRVHGETWCAYQSDIGFDDSASDNTRSVDTPGARHFRKVCYEGEVRTEPCEDYRNEICVENKMDIGNGKTFSSAACIKNLAAQCLTYNSKAEDTLKKECNENPFCAIKTVHISEYFKFSMCVPRHPVGHDLTTGEGGNACSKASMTCTVVYVKKLSSGKYEVQQNGGCEGDKFAEQMNDLCMSMGDCGAEVNYMGELSTDGYSAQAEKVSDIESKKNIYISDAYKAAITKYHIPVEGKTSDVNLSTWTYQSKEVDPEKSKLKNSVTDDMADFLMISGAAGLALAGMTHAGWFGLLAVSAKGFTPWTAWAAEAGPTAPWFGASAGALIGAAITYLLIQWSGVGPGLNTATTYTLIVSGAAAGFLIGYNAVATTVATGASALTAIGPAGAAFWVPVIGWALAALVVLAIALMKIMKIGDIKERDVTFACKQWQPPLGGKDCAKCGADGFKCSKYACSSLGQTCKFVNEDTGQEMCVDTSPNDVSPPIIAPWIGILTEGFNYTNATQLGVSVKSSSGDGCIPAYTRVNFGIAMSKVGKCKYSLEPGVDFKDMDADFGDSLFRENHSMLMTSPSPEMLGITTYNPNQRIDYNLYVKCENVNGYPHAADYAINFCVSPQRDVTPPVIVWKEPQIDFIKGDEIAHNVTIYVNEPADCKWDVDNREFDLMTGNMTCYNRFEQQSILGWACRADMPVPKNESIYYVRCLDKPWETNESARNQGDSYKIRMVKTSALEIDSATPDNETIASGVQPVTTIVNVETSGGLDGTARCTYSFDNVNFFDFADTFGKTHKQTFEFWEAGTKDIEIKCIDSVGNEADKNISVVIELDTTAPQITLVYQTAGSLTVKTDEASECRISFDSCKFNYENATLMSGTGLTHTIPVALKTLYYVKCKDAFGNAKGDCDLTLKLL